MSIVCFILVIAFIFVMVGDLSLLTSTDIRVNWAPVAAPKEVIVEKVFNKTKAIEVNQWEVFDDPTEVIEPLHVKEVAVKKKDVAVIELTELLPDGSLWVTQVAVKIVLPLEVAEISLRGRRGLFGRQEPVCFV